MGYELIISEKPNAAKKIAEALADGKPLKEAKNGVPSYFLTHNNKDIRVVCAVGHLFGVAEKKKSFTYPSYDIEWVATASIDKSAAFSKKYAKVIEKMAKEADSFTVACDYDVEGEVIGLNIIRYLCHQKDANRMKFSTLTHDELCKSYDKKAKSLDWGQGLAGETRHFLDWLYGINLSRALMLAVKKAGGFSILSIGRVQGPALKIIVDKEREIKAFKSEPYWQIEVTTKKDAITFTALHKTEKFWKKEEADAIHQSCKDKDLIVKKREAKAFKQVPPTPFDLGSLQTEAYKIFHFSPKRTLQLAQNLYLSGSTSYPRTSSQKLPKELNFPAILKGLGKQEPYAKIAANLLSKSKLIPHEGKKTDPAHPAIYPTGAPPKGITTEEKKLYDLIVRRFFAVFGTPATRETVTVVLELGAQPFIAKGTTTTDPGWHALYDPYVRFKETMLPALSEGETLPLLELAMHAKETTPPKRYTPSSIITELEKKGLGTKATRADIIESLYSRGYVHEKSIEATELGIKTLSTLEKYCPKIIEEELTRSIEDEMEKIREESIEPKTVLDHAKKALDGILNHFKKNEALIGKELLTAQRETHDQQSLLGSCPVCKKGDLKIMYSKKTKKRFVGCSSYPDCSVAMPLPQTGKIKRSDAVCEHDQYPIIEIQQRGKRPQKVCLYRDCKAKSTTADVSGQTCPKCNKPLAIKKSIYGEFIGCSGYPSCKYTASIEKKEEPQKDG